MLMNMERTHIMLSIPIYYSTNPTRIDRGALDITNSLWEYAAFRYHCIMHATEERTQKHSRTYVVSFFVSSLGELIGMFLLTQSWALMFMLVN